ncbi:Ig-like domain-containing protein [Polaromonas sp.]|uniref:Ig-like domain-containing protein n=1 Tax=Polaromonas sp. TaxID=1869339 RepID=UPI00286C4D4F|nr:Ig-like domain-containing protein [Polaromonas sp.]
MQVHRFLSFLLPLLATGFIATAPQLAGAQSRARFAPEISSFQVDVSDRLGPGSDIDFTLEGTPRGKASVRIGGVNKTIALREVERGVYEGSYTLSRRDRLGPQPTARATLRVRNASTVATQALAGGPPPVATLPPPPAVPPAVPAPAPLVIERFGVTPIARIEPGADLRFAAVGTPGARASFTIDGVVQGVAMPEVRPGRYEGAYTIRRNDNFPPSLNISAALEANGQVARSRLNQALLVDARPPTIRNLAPHNNETVTGNPASVSATFDDSGGVGVDTKSVKIMIGGQDMTRNASITPQFITWRGDLRPGSYPVEITAADNAGNTVKQTWAFNVTGPQTPPPAAMLPLQITSHANNAQVGNGVIEVRGRTAPDAKVDIQVQVVASVAGFFGINQQVLNQTVRSDANGVFGFSFQAQVPVPGARFEANITATKGDLSRETRLVLFQQH